MVDGTVICAETVGVVVIILGGGIAMEIGIAAWTGRGGSAGAGAVAGGGSMEEEE